MKEKLRKHKKKLIILGIILVLIIAGNIISSNIAKRQRNMMESMNQPETASVEKRTLMSSISATGSITSVESKEISVSLSNAEVETVNVKIGDMVEAGTILCTFQSEDIEESLAEAKASLNVTTTKTQMDIASSERSLAETVESNNINLNRINEDITNAWSDYEEAMADVEEAEDDYEDAEDEVDALAAQIEQYNTNKNKYTKQQTTYSEQFTATKEELLAYISDNPDKCKDTATSAVEEIALDTPLTVTAADIIIDDGDTTDVAAIIIKLQEAQDGYNKAVNALSKLGNLAELQKSYESAKQNESAMKNAYDQAVSASENQYDAYEQKLRSQEDTVRSNESSIANKTDSVTTSKLNATTSGTSEKNQIEQYEEQLENCTVTSPISGVITALNVEAGDTYSGNVIATIEDISAYKITTEIDEYDIVDIEPGQKVVIKTNGTGDLELDGTVETVAPRATATTGNNSEVTYTVTITVDTPCDDLKLDMTAKLNIILESKENVLAVPYNAVQEDEEGNYYIEVINENSSSVNTDEMDHTGSTDKVHEKEIAQIPAENNNMSQMSGTMMQRPGGRGGNHDNTMESSSLNTSRIYITKGIESDYYIEVISNEITEGMQVIVPHTEDNQSIMNMMMNRGPMGGF